MTEESLKLGIKLLFDGIRRCLVADAEPAIEARMPEFYQKLEKSQEIFELQRLWDEVTEFLKEVEHDWNQNLRELQIMIEDRIESKGGIRPKINE